jgi:hypothetical protein
MAEGPAGRGLPGLHRHRADSASALDEKVRKYKFETRSTKSETNSNDRYFKIQNIINQVLDI